MNEVWISGGAPTTGIRTPVEISRDQICRQTVEEEKNCTSRVQSLSKAAMAKAAMAKAAMAVWVAVAPLNIEGAQAKTPVSIELVLAVDTSISVDGFEFDLMMKGFANAFRTPEIVNLIGQQDGVAVTLFQWSSAVNERYMIPWRLLKDPASVLSFAAKVEKAERDPTHGFTGIGEAIDFGVRLISENAFEGRQLKVDVSGDGRNNIGVPLSIPRQKANAVGIVINGLPILTYTDVDSHDLGTYYREKVILGPGAFVEIANDYDDFARAFLRKLLRELTPLVSQEDAAPRAPVQEAHARQPNVRCGCASPYHGAHPERSISVDGFGLGFDVSCRLDIGSKTPQWVGAAARRYFVGRTSTLIRTAGSAPRFSDQWATSAPSTHCSPGLCTISPNPSRCSVYSPLSR